MSAHRPCPAEAAGLCQDACARHLPLLPVLRAVWLRRGQQVRVPTPGTNRRRAVFGAVEGETRRWLYAIIAPCGRWSSARLQGSIDALVAAEPQFFASFTPKDARRRDFTFT